MINSQHVSKDEIKHAENLLKFINTSPSPFHAVQSVKEQLLSSGFKELRFEDKWTLLPKEKYFVSRNGSALIAFVLGESTPEKLGFHILGTHTDSPTFRLKPSPVISVEGKYLKLNVETYGGPILNTWLDRPLALAGRVILKGKSSYLPGSVLFQSPSPLLTIPNLAIHMNRQVNDGIALNKQKDLLPLLGMQGGSLEEENVLLKYFSELLQTTPEDILDFDMVLYEYENGNIMGLNQEFISSSRLDDLAMVHAGTWALSQTQNNQATAVLACFDNEEVGSTSKQGAASPLLASVLERIMLALGKNREEYYQALAQSFMVSADMAHALHPNAVEKHDPVNRPVLNSGPVIKLSANLSYTSDAESTVIFQRICEEAKVPVQIFVNRSDERGGSTIGPISTTHLDIRSV
jgi:aspartyl aminopeptidase